MLNERLQILVTAAQRRRLEHEAQRRGASVGSVIRDALDEQLGRVTETDRLEALDAIAALPVSLDGAEDVLAALGRPAR